MDHAALNAESERRFGPLDVALALARNLRLLILLPLLAAGAAYLVGNWLPRLYTSAAIISAPNSSAEASMRSAEVLDEVLLTFPGSEVTSEQRRKWLNDKIVWERARNSSSKANDASLMNLSLTDNNATVAHDMAAALIEAWVKSLKPDGHELKKLDDQVKLIAADLSATDSAVVKLEAELGTGTSQSADGLVTLYALRHNYKKELAEIRSRLDGLQPDEAVVSSPTMPDDGTSRTRQFVPIAALLTFLLAAIVSVARANIRHMEANPLVTAKIMQLRAALHFKSKA